MRNYIIKTNDHGHGRAMRVEIDDPLGRLDQSASALSRDQHPDRESQRRTILRKCLDIITDKYPHIVDIMSQTEHSKSQVSMGHIWGCLRGGSCIFQS